MKLILLFGPQAVGKMTVGQELEKITGLKLFHNHMTIELVTPFFNYGTTTGKKLVNLFRRKIFEEVAKSDLDGMIFTYVWALDLKVDWMYVKKLREIFESRGGTVYFVELEADLNERLKRNRSPHRLEQKPTKRNVKRSEKNLLKTLQKHRLNSNPGELPKKNYLRIDNSKLTAKKTATLIKKTFKL